MCQVIFLYTCGFQSMEPVAKCRWVGIAILRNGIQYLEGERVPNPTQGNSMPIAQHSTLQVHRKVGYTV
jgi:hypothetical protein